MRCHLTRKFVLASLVKCAANTKCCAQLQISSVKIAIYVEDYSTVWFPYSCIYVREVVEYVQGGTQLKLSCIT